MPAIADLGAFTPSSVVTFKFATVNAAGGLEAWNGLVLLVRPGGQGSEDGISYSLDSPEDGRHTVTIDLAAAAANGGELSPGRYKLILFGDPIDGEVIQGVAVATFDVTEGG